MQTITDAHKKMLIKFLRESVTKRGFHKIVVGLSGGIDSAVVAALCQEAFSQERYSQNQSYEKRIHKDTQTTNCKVVLMPSLNSSQSSIQDALELCQKLNIEYEILSIQGFDEVFCKNHPNHTALARGNFCARMRMATLYHVSQMEQRLVIGTSNKSEIMLGYGTIFGDLACAINPIAHLYKTQIYQLAHLLGIPRSIIDKPPSADLYQGQSDEKDLGYNYSEIDKFLESYEQYHTNNIQEKKAYLQSLYPSKMVESLMNRIQKNAFKTEPIERYSPN
ncbi:NAD(+) synthase [Helicobacter aurati]|uniref:NH(3)-dependent NAD(+) synthetase n=1 Tax=Helicobacter aurati TaxID=137778 RepID=A0A3D8J398_9HELI|nr:NAD(+) synthase [Helicobacter aurati]RDU71625.1 NAD(+) synthase [Helicobacter aurati]